MNFNIFQLEVLVNYKSLFHIENLRKAIIITILKGGVYYSFLGKKES